MRGSFTSVGGRGSSEKGKKYIWSFKEAFVGWNRAGFGQALNHIFLEAIFWLFDQTIAFVFEYFAIIKIGRRPFGQSIPPSHCQLFD